MTPSAILRREYDPAQLLARHPPLLSHPHKRGVFELCCPPGARHAGSIAVSRWAAGGLPETLAGAEAGRTEVVAMAGHYVYERESAGVWHVNFADPRLFFGYGSRLLAQDELQALEHPLLGPLREALASEGQAMTVGERGPTPVLVAGVERRCTLATAPDRGAGRPHGLYGNGFASAPWEVVRRAVTLPEVPTHSNLLAIAAPGHGSGAYSLAELELVLLTALTGFTAVALESARLWPGTPVEIRTGFWGCGAFGGDRRAMTLLQLLAARLARIDRLRFYAYDDAGRAAFAAGARDLERVLGAGSTGVPLAAVLRRTLALRYAWGVGDGT